MSRAKQQKTAEPDVEGILQDLTEHYLSLMASAVPASMYRLVHRSFSKAAGLCAHVKDKVEKDCTDYLPDDYDASKFCYNDCISWVENDQTVQKWRRKHTDSIKKKMTEMDQGEIQAEHAVPSRGPHDEWWSRVAEALQNGPVMINGDLNLTTKQSGWRPLAEQQPAHQPACRVRPAHLHRGWQPPCGRRPLLTGVRPAQSASQPPCERRTFARRVRVAPTWRAHTLSL